MIPQEKGDELISKYLDLQIHGLSTIAASNRAVQCSIIAVEEIINEFPQGYKGNFEEKRKQYWNEVLNYLKSKQ